LVGVSPRTASRPATSTNGSDAGWAAGFSTSASAGDTLVTPLTVTTTANLRVFEAVFDFVLVALNVAAADAPLVALVADWLPPAW
jgi:hypothetical protein